MTAENDADREALGLAWKEHESLMESLEHFADRADFDAGFTAALTHARQPGEPVAWQHRARPKRSGPYSWGCWESGHIPAWLRDHPNYVSEERALYDHPAPQPSESGEKKSDPYEAWTICHECGAHLPQSDAQWSDDGSPFCKRHKLHDGLTPPAGEG